MLRRWLLIFTVIAGPNALVFGQCEYAFREIDEFDGTLTVATHPVNVGYMIPSNFETSEGVKIIEEGKLMFSFTEEAHKDTGIISFFITLAVQEYEFHPIESGENVLIALSDSTVIGLYNLPSSQFDRTTNMRLYTHTCVLPIDVFYKLVYNEIIKIRIYYRTQKKDIEVLPDQQAELKEMLRCVGRGAGVYPLKP